jgi:predicted nucleic acid-binding protein
MSLHVDASALLKLYFDEPDSDRAEAILTSDEQWIMGRHGSIEVRRSLARALEGSSLVAARRQFERDWQAMAVVELTPEVCAAAAELAEVTDARTLDALHLGVARVVGGGAPCPS